MSELYIPIERLTSYLSNSNLLPHYRMELSGEIKY